MEIRNYITFNAVVEEDGFTKAAHRLNYGQSTITLHIKELETHYNQLLFDRIGKKIFLTSFGKNLYEMTKPLIEHYQDVLSINEHHSLNQVLRVGVFESLLHYRIQDLIQVYKEKYPHVDLVIRHGTCTELRDMVRTGQLDLTFQIEPIMDFIDLKSEVLTEELFSLIFPKGKGLELMADKNQTVYLTEKECSYRGAFEQFLDQKGIVKHRYMETGSVEVIKQYVACGLGYSFVPSVTLRDAATLERLECISYELDTPMYTQILYHKDKCAFPAMEDFLILLRTYAKDWY